MTEINTTHTSLSNIGIDNYVVTTTTNANASSNQGGNAVVATENAQMDGGDVFLPTVEFPDTLVTSKIKNDYWNITIWFRNIFRITSYNKCKNYCIERKLFL